MIGECIVITRVEFADFMRRLESSYREAEDIYNGFDDIITPEFFYSHDYFHFATELLAKMMKTTQNDIEWWIYEANFGKNVGFAEINVDGEVYKVDTAEKFYDYLVATAD